MFAILEVSLSKTKRVATNVIFQSTKSLIESAFRELVFTAAARLISATGVVRAVVVVDWHPCIRRVWCAPRTPYLAPPTGLGGGLVLSPTQLQYA